MENHDPGDRKDYQEFVEMMKRRTKKFATDCFRLCETLPTGRAYGTIVFQLVKSSTSTGANYRAACRARSKKEFYSKLSIVVEEADESLYWLEQIQDLETPCNQEEVKRLVDEITELLKIVAKARKNSK